MFFVHTFIAYFTLSGFILATISLVSLSLSKVQTFVCTKIQRHWFNGSGIKTQQTEQVAFAL